MSVDTVDDYMHDGLVEDHDGAPYPEHVQHVVGLFRAEVDRLRAALEAASAHAVEASDYADRYKAENDRLRALLAKALPWIDPNDSHEDYLLTVAIREALGEES